MTGSDYQVSPTALDRIAAGIETVLDGLAAIGPRGAADQGRGVEQLADAPGDVGHAELNVAFVAFCLRWEWGVRAAVHDGTELVDGLRASATAYERADGDGAEVFARVAFDLLGDPAELGGGTWADVAAARMPDPRPPDVASVGAALGDAVQGLAEASAAVLIVRALRGDDPGPDPLDDLRPIVR